MAFSVFAPLGALRRVTVLALWGFGLLSGSGASATPSPDEVRERLRTRIEAVQKGASEALLVDDDRILAQQGVVRFYQQSGFAPAWTTPTGPMVLADSLLAVLRDASRAGLRPADYHVPAIDWMRRRLRAQAGAGEPLDPGRLADFELLCTDAFLLHGSHLLTGRVDPVEIAPSWNLHRQETDLVQRLKTTLAEASLRSALEGLRPPQPEYAAVRRALRRYRTFEAQGGWPTLPDGPKLEAGVRDERVPLLRHRLRATGDLPEPVPPEDSFVFDDFEVLLIPDLHTPDAEDPLVFDDSLRQAVSRFQERHGLEVDGVVGPATRAALNVPVKARLRQITVNMECWRWLPRDLGTHHVLVNIAGFWLRVVEDGTDVLRMRVITGQPYRQTPIFSGEISYLVFNRYWHVPQSIAVRDKLPDFRKDPSLVSKRGYEVFRGWGTDARPIDPQTTDWNGVSASTFPYRLRQRPGPQKALGQVKFMFPNPYSVYLHDTPSRSLFTRAERSFNSGCIRVEHPLDLATCLLRENEDWTRERIQTALGKDAEQTVVLKQKVPVHLLYWTAWVETEGTLHLRKDVYDRDGAVLSALTSGPPEPRAV